MAQRMFGTDGIRGKVGTDPLVHPQSIQKLGWAIGKILSRGHKNPSILIAKDTRVSGYMLESALESGLAAAGINVVLCGPLPTPAVAYLTQTIRASGGIMVSASHNSYMDNGIKIFNHNGFKLDEKTEKEIEEMYTKPMDICNSDNLGKAKRLDGAHYRYIEYCKSKLNSKYSLQNLKIALDCANGSSYVIAPHVLTELGAELYSIGTEPNGYNINLDCGSSKPEAIKQLVTEKKADIGIALDGDGDRLLMVDENGNTLDGDDILYIIAVHAHNQGHCTGIVTTICSNLGLRQALIQRGIQVEICPVGDRQVAYALQQHGWYLGAEPSGHIINLHNASCGDGLISALTILGIAQETGKKVAELRSGWTRCPALEINIASCTPNQDINNHEIVAKAKEIKRKLNKNGLLIIRASGTEPLIRISIQGHDRAYIATQLQELEKICHRVCG